MLWVLQLAGDWHASEETAVPHPEPHLMRVMLVSNLAVEQRFANGTQQKAESRELRAESREPRGESREPRAERTQGRLMSWHPSQISNKKAVLASHPELTARFVKESSLGKAELYPDIDHMDLIVRQETLPMVAGHPVMLQMCTVPAYALTVPISTARTRNSIAKRSQYDIDRSTRCSR